MIPLQTHLQLYDICQSMKLQEEKRMKTKESRKHVRKGRRQIALSESSNYVTVRSSMKVFTLAEVHQQDQVTLCRGTAWKTEKHGGQHNETRHLSREVDTDEMMKE